MLMLQIVIMWRLLPNSERFLKQSCVSEGWYNDPTETPQKTRNVQFCEYLVSDPVHWGNDKV